METDFPPDYEALKNTAKAAGWLLSGGWAAGYRTPLTFSAFRPDGIWPNYERRQWFTGDAVRVWIEAGCPSLSGGWVLQQCSSGLWEAHHLTRLTVCYGNTEAQALVLVGRVEAAMVTSRAAREEWQAKQKPRKRACPKTADTQLSLFEEAA